MNILLDRNTFFDRYLEFLEYRNSSFSNSYLSNVEVLEVKVGFLTVRVNADRIKSFGVLIGDTCFFSHTDGSKTWECTIENMYTVEETKKTILFLSMSTDFIPGVRNKMSGILAFGDDFSLLYEYQQEVLRKTNARFPKLFGKQDIANTEAVLKMCSREELDEEFTDEEVTFEKIYKKKLPFPIHVTEKLMQITQEIDEIIKSNSQDTDKQQTYTLQEIKKWVFSEAGDSSEIEDKIKIIWGPPGTGKTYIIAKICEIILKMKKRLIITSFTHVAVDNALEKILENELLDFTSCRILRYGDKQKVAHQKIKELTSRNVDVEVDPPEIFGITLDALLLPRWGILENSKKMYDFAIVDESSMASFPKLLNILIKAKKVIYVGDFMQLFPFDTFDEKYLNVSTLHIYKTLSSFSFFMFLSLAAIDSFKEKKLGGGIFFPLLTNRRSNPDLIRFSNSNFYMNLLKSPEKDRIPKKDILLQNLIPKNMPVGLCEIFFNKSGKPILLDPQSFTGDGKHPMQNSISRSVRVQIKKMNGYLVRCTYANPDQIAITIQLIFQFLRLPGNTILDLRNIGVITFFRLQAQVLKSWFFHNGLYLYKATENSIKILPEKNNLETTLNNWAKLLYKIWISQNLEIGTVERFQGREKDFIITNTVYHPTINTGRVHPAFKDFRRLNVVLTRPKSLHIIISRSMKKNEEATWLYDLFHGNKYPNDYISIPKSGFFLNLDWKLEPAVKLQSLSYRNEEKCTGSIFSTIEKITGQKINLGERGALRIDLDDSYESSSTEIELHTSIESSLNSIAKAFIRNTRYQKTVNSEKEKNILKEVVVYTCNKIHRLCYLDVQEDPNNISKMIRKLYYLFVDSEYYKVLVKILNQTLNDSTGEDNWQTTELDIFIEKWMKLNNQKIQHSSVE